jgi:K+-transporting ATPase KdpF subunit
VRACGAMGDRRMALEYVLTGLIALAVGIYLLVALLRPDRF